MAYKGKYRPINTDKYKGDINNITYRSLWERTVMKSLDMNPNIIMWMSEELAIPYYSHIDQKQHKYYPDFLVKIKNIKGESEVVMIEVKPFNQTKKPKEPKKKTRRFINESITYEINSAKWETAREYCRQKGWSFKIMTERDIFSK